MTITDNGTRWDQLESNEVGKWTLSFVGLLVIIALISIGAFIFSKGVKTVPVGHYAVIPLGGGHYRVAESNENVFTYKDMFIFPEICFVPAYETDYALATTKDGFSFGVHSSFVIEMPKSCEQRIKLFEYMQPQITGSRDVRKILWDYVNSNTEEVSRSILTSYSLDDYMENSSKVDEDVCANVKKYILRDIERLNETSGFDIKIKTISFHLRPSADVASIRSHRLIAKEEIKRIGFMAKHLVAMSDLERLRVKVDSAIKYEKILTQMDLVESVAKAEADAITDPNDFIARKEQMQEQVQEMIKILEAERKEQEKQVDEMVKKQLEEQEKRAKEIEDTWNEWYSKYSKDPNSIE